jgi:indole-3-glycerol phosphate synthase
VSILEKIVGRVRERLDAAQRETSLGEVRAKAAAAASRPAFRAALERPGTAVIAEAKRASPSKGVLRDPYDAAQLARLYERAGARALSVLTEPEFFLGAPQDLQRVAHATALPILRKDFIVSEYQIQEAKAWGASAVLLIVAMLEIAELRDLAAIAAGLDLAALVEVHTEKETEQALAAGAHLIGVNNRDLSTFTVDLNTTARVAALLPPEVLLVAESGIFTRRDVLEVERAGAKAVLVGESLLVSPDPTKKIHELLGLTRSEVEA